MKKHACDRARIDAYLASDDEIEDPILIECLTSCSNCQEYFNEQTASEGQWSRARQLLQPCQFDEATISSFSAGGFWDPRSGSPQGAIQDVLQGLAPSDDPDRLGRIDGYEVSGVVGVGGMGVVLKAVDPALDRVVAIKVLSPHLAGSEKARQRFSREARAAAAVLHPNVIPIYSVSKRSSMPYLVMAYARGGSLQKRIDREGALAELEVLRIGSQVAAGLAAAHEQGLVHRDIKPENIMLEGEVDRVAITDFGLARAVDDNSLTQAGAIAGTPMYMSPEQARGEKIDPKSDLFSLGSVLYALCTGQPPYRADTSYGVMRKIIDESPTPVRAINPSVPQWLSNIVEKLMTPEKAARFGSAEEVHQLLEGCLNHIQQPDSVPLPKGLPRKSKLNLSITRVGAMILSGVILAAASGAYALGTFGDLDGASRQAPSTTAAAETTNTEKSRTGDSPNLQNENDAKKGGEKQARRAVNHADPKAQQLEDFGEAFRWAIERNPELRLKLAADAMARGDEEGAKKLLAMVPDKDPLAESKISLAELLEESGKHDKAVDAYLEAYRRDPELVDVGHFQHFKKTGRMSELATLMTEDFLKKMGRTYQSIHFVKEMLADAKTRKDGVRLLERIWNAQPYYHSALLQLDSDCWKEVESPVRFLRPKLMPENIDAEGKGWKRFTIESTSPTEGFGTSALLELQPLLANQSAAAELTIEVEAGLKQHPRWQAGFGLLAVLQARAGQFEKAIQNVQIMLGDIEAIPSDSAWVFGLALAGMNATLDREAIRLFEHSLETRNPRVRILRTSPLGDLGVLYGKAGNKKQARALLYRLASNKEIEPGLTRFPANEKFYNVQAAARRFLSLGMPADGLLLLGQVNSGMTDIDGGNDRWVRTNFLKPFHQLKKEAEATLTPANVLEAWDAGVFFSPGEPANKATVESRRVDLRLNVNSVGLSRSRLDSAVLQVFESVCRQSNSGERDTPFQSELLQVDDRITSLLKENPKHLQCAILAAAFSLYRQDYDEARTRLQFLQELVATPEYKRDNKALTALWPVAREALRHPNTRGIGKSLGDLAARASQKGPREWKSAIARERGKGN